MPRCPVCKIVCEQIKYEGVPIYNCGSCGGHWLSQARLDVIVHRREYQMPEEVQKKIIEIAKHSNTTRKLLCLSCAREMRKIHFKHWSDIMLDQCPKCGGIWFDQCELEKCQIYWEYLQDHPEEWDKLGAVTRKALLEAEFQERQAQLRDKKELAELAAKTRYPGSIGAAGLINLTMRLFGGR